MLCKFCLPPLRRNYYEMVEVVAKPLYLEDEGYIYNQSKRTRKRNYQIDAAN